MSHRPHVLMLDEPTAALDMRFAAHLEELIIRARDEGTAIVYVSHRLEEVRRLADRLTVLRDGVIQGTHSSRDWDVDQIVELMVGAPPSSSSRNGRGPRRRATAAGHATLPDRATARSPERSRSGEIVGIAGAEGNGQRALLRGLIGIGRNDGEVVVDGKRAVHGTPSAALQAGISFQSGDRAAESVYGQLSVMDNCTAQLGADAGPPGWRCRASFARRSGRRAARSASSRPRRTNRSARSPVETSRRRYSPAPRSAAPKVLVLDEPTQGVDARARMDIYRVIADAADEGIGVLVNSSDSAELAGLCDRVYVMSRGTIVHELEGPTSEAAIVRGFVSAGGSMEHQPGHAAEGAGPWSRLLATLAARLPIVVLLVLTAIVAIYTGTRSDVFWSTQNLATLLLLSLPLAFVALGQQFTLLSGGFDISVGSTMSLTVVCASITLPDLAASSIIATTAVLLCVALLVGGFNAFTIGVLKVNPVVATIATMGIVQGVAIVLRPTPEGYIAPQLGTAFSQGVAFLPAPFLVLVVLTITLEIWLYRSRTGLAVRGVGFNAESSKRIGRRVPRVRSAGLLVCALGAVVAGVFLASQTGVGSNSVGASYALPCFAAVFLGGAVMTGGRGSFVGAVLGAVFLALLDNVTPLLNIPNATRQTLYGVILLVAIGTYAVVQRMRTRRGLN